MDSIKGANFNLYDAQHLQLIRRDTAQSLKLDLFKEVEDPVAQALLYTDVVSLSPEAKELLNKLKKQMAGKGSRADSKEQDFEQLLFMLGQFREQVQKEQQQQQDEGGQKKADERKERSNVPQHAPQPMTWQLGQPLRGARKLPGQDISVGEAQAREIVSRMVFYAPEGRARDMVGRELGVLGETMVSEVAGARVRIVVLEPNRALTDLKNPRSGMYIIGKGERTFDGRDWTGVRGLYDQKHNLIVIGEERLGHAEHSAARHEFAHAFDHIFTEKKGRRQPLSVELWNRFAPQRKGLITPYAGTNPAEYFAESVEAFFKPTGRERLQEVDPLMYQYLEVLFAS